MYVDYLSSFVSFVLLLIRILLYHLYKAEYIYICVCVYACCVLDAFLTGGMTAAESLFLEFGKFMHAFN